MAAENQSALPSPRSSNGSSSAYEINRSQSGNPQVKSGGVRIARALRDKFTQDPALQVPGMTPNWGNWPVPHTMTLQGLVNNISKVYRISDEALNDSFDQARFMEYDIGIWECIEARTRAVVLLGWHLSPEDEKDPEQVACVEQLTKILEYMPRFMQFREQLMLANWYGRSATQSIVGWDWIGRKAYIKPKQWLPIHGDKLVFRLMDGDLSHPQNQVGIRVGLTYSANDRISKGLTDAYGNKLPDHWQVEPTDRGLAYFLTEAEQNLLCIHKHQIQDGAFERPTDAGRIHGVGIRNRIYWEWFMKQNTLQWLMEYIERSAFGLELWFYPMHNDKAKADAEQAIKQRTGPFRNVLMVPVPPDDGSGQQYGVQHVETGLAGADLLMNVVDKYFGHRIKRLILGQTLTTEADATGLGSGVASIHLLSFRDIVKYDAINLQETLSDWINYSIKPWNFPNSSHFRVKFVIETEPVDADEKLSAMEKAWQMGARIKEKDVLEAIGAAAPTPADLILPGPAAPTDPSAAVGGGAAPGEVPGEDDEEGEEIEEGEGDEEAAEEEATAAAEGEQANELEEDTPEQFSLTAQYAFDESKHPRGQPENAGQFVEHPSSTSHIPEHKKAHLQSVLSHVFGGGGPKSPFEPASISYKPINPQTGTTAEPEPALDPNIANKDFTKVNNGDEMMQWLKGKFYYTELQLQKIGKLNPYGAGSKLRVPKALNDKQIEQLKKILPEGTIIQRVSAPAHKLGLISGKGGGGEYEIYKGEKGVTGTIGSGDAIKLKAAGILPDVAVLSQYSHKLSSAEQSAISSWKSNPHQIRKEIAEGQLTDKSKAFLSAIDKAPQFTGTVYRGFHNSGSNKYADDQMKAIGEAGVGGVWLDNAPMGTSRSPEVSIKNFSHGDVILHLHVKTVRVVEHVDGYGGEKENITMPGQKFRIVKIVKNCVVNGKKMKMYVELEEI